MTREQESKELNRKWKKARDRDEEREDFAGMTMFNSTRVNSSSAMELWIIKHFTLFTFYHSCLHP